VTVVHVETVSLTQFWGTTCTVPSTPNPFAQTCALVSDGVPTAASAKRRGKDDDTDGFPNLDDDTGMDNDDDGEDESSSEEGDDAIEVGLVERAELTSYQITCAAQNTNYRAIVSVSQVRFSTFHIALISS
jgi:hypothetical protein